MSQRTQVESDAISYARFQIHHASKWNNTELDLSGRELVELPATIGLLANLRILKLGYNPSTEVETN